MFYCGCSVKAYKTVVVVLFIIVMATLPPLVNKNGYIHSRLTHWGLNKLAGCLAFSGIETVVFSLKRHLRFVLHVCHNQLMFMPLYGILFLYLSASVGCFCLRTFFSQTDWTSYHAPPLYQIYILN